MSLPGTLDVMQGGGGFDMSTTGSFDTTELTPESGTGAGSASGTVAGNSWFKW